MPLPPASSPFWQTDGGKFAAYAQRANGRTNGQGECGEEGLREQLAGRRFRKTFGQIQIQFARWGGGVGGGTQCHCPGMCASRQTAHPPLPHEKRRECVCVCLCAQCGANGSRNGLICFKLFSGIWRWPNKGKKDDDDDDDANPDARRARKGGEHSKVNRVRSAGERVEYFGYEFEADSRLGCLLCIRIFLAFIFFVCCSYNPYNNNSVALPHSLSLFLALSSSHSLELRPGSRVAWQRLASRLILDEKRNKISQND